MLRHTRFQLQTALICLAMCSTCAAQNAENKSALRSGNGLDAVRATKPIKPAFLISPLVHQLTAQRGQLVQFEFEIESNLEATSLEISAVGMRQQENGVILPDTSKAVADGVRLLTPARINLPVGGKHTAKCQLRIPAENNPFLIYGILVKQLPPPDSNGNDADQPQVGIRFMTQYLLRADIDVLGVRGDTVSKLEIEQAELQERNGAAMVTVFINNPTDTPMEYQLRTELVSKDSGKRYKSRLYVPVRVSQDGPERYDARILDETRLRMEGELPDAVFPGEYSLNVELLHKGRIYKKADFPVSIHTGDFPAQDATIVRVAKDISVEPPNIEFSLRRGGSRIQSIAIENSSQQKVFASLVAKPLIGELANWITFRPEVLELGPGQKRKVLVMLGNKRDFEEHSYALAGIEVRPERGQAIGNQDIPVCLLTNSESAAELKPGGLQWKSAPTGFQVPVENAGARHVPLQGRLTLRDDFGRGFVVEDGYGRWLLPGKSDQFWFPFRQVPPPGNYNVRIELSQGEDVPTMQIEQTIQIRSATDKRVSDRPAETTTE